MIFKVTQEDIDMGTPANACTCPIALCISRTLTGDKNVFDTPDVMASLSRICIGNTEHNTPVSCYLFMKRFDTDMKVLPFEFELSYEPAI